MLLIFITVEVKYRKILQSVNFRIFLRKNISVVVLHQDF